ncbi:MAG: hypothetical protein FJ288_10365 [Planctomycetes bacterium]|nr:hypothetical protein [Planctomycetota bacterium]
MTAASIQQAPRPWWQRLASAGVVVLGGLFGVGGAALFALFAARWQELYDRFELRGGLPMPVQRLMDLNRLLTEHGAEAAFFWAAWVLVLAVLAARARRRWAFSLAGWFAVVCFFGWYGMLFLLILCCSLLLLPCTHAY